MAKLILDSMLKKKKMSKRQLAKRTGIAYSSVFRYFKKGYDPKLSVLSKWAEALSCRVRDLIEE